MWALQVSCHIPVFPQALMENGGMEWEEIYGTNPSRVLKTLASAAATSPLFPSVVLLDSLPPCAVQPKPREGETGQPIRCVSQHLAKVFSCSCLLQTTRTWTPLTPCGGFQLF